MREIFMFFIFLNLITIVCSGIFCEYLYQIKKKDKNLDIYRFFEKILVFRLIFLNLLSTFFLIINVIELLSPIIIITYFRPYFFFYIMPAAGALYLIILKIEALAMENIEKWFEIDQKLLEDGKKLCKNDKKLIKERVDEYDKYTYKYKKKKTFSYFIAFLLSAAAALIVVRLDILFDFVELLKSFSIDYLDISLRHDQIINLLVLFFFFFAIISDILWNLYIIKK